MSKQQQQAPAESFSGSFFSSFFFFESPSLSSPSFASSLAVVVAAAAAVAVGAFMVVAVWQWGVKNNSEALCAQNPMPYVASWYQNGEKNKARKSQFFF